MEEATAPEEVGAVEEAGAAEEAVEDGLEDGLPEGSPLAASEALPEGSPLEAAEGAEATEGGDAMLGEEAPEAEADADADGDKEESDELLQAQLLEAQAAGMEGDEQEEMDALLEAESLEAQAAAAEAETGVETEEKQEGAEDMMFEVQEHLKDAVDGSLRLKRLLTGEVDIDAPDAKKMRIFGAEDGSEQGAKVNHLMMKWGLPQDVMLRHVLTSITLAEVEVLAKSNFVPDKFNDRRPPAELVQKHVCELRERSMVGGGRMDCVGAFKHRKRLGGEQEKLLRSLSHKELRFVFEGYKGAAVFEEVVSEAAVPDAEDEDPAPVTAEGALPDLVGISTYSRFQRLELIDPFADCGIFGDANLTFALKLAEHRKALGHVGRVIATTFEELQTLRERYNEIDESIKILEGYNAEVFHGVDCTRIALNPDFRGLENSLGGIYYNFPHSGAIPGFFDGHPVVNWRHENLMRLFFRALRPYVKEGGIVKVASNMSATGVRASYIIGSAIQNEFVHVETMPFLEWHLHRYGRSYGDKRDSYKRPDAKNNQSYNAQRAEADMVYCFRYEPSGETLPAQEIRRPPTLKTLMTCPDGPFRTLQGQGRQKLAHQLHKRFLTEVGGTHVG